MKIAKLAVLILLISILSVFGSSSGALAFHDGGVASCGGCHTMHPANKANKAGQNSGQNPTVDSHNQYLLLGSDPSSTCLRCHAKEFSVLSKDGSDYTPGGDFFWLTKSYNAQVGDQAYHSPGDSHGHNVIALDYGLKEDGTLFSAPNDGTVDYQSSWLSCTSCHDPHGRIQKPKPIAGSGSYGQSSPQKAETGNYRLLGGVGYKGGSLATGFQFAHPAPIARAYPAVNGQYPAERNNRHVDYGSGMSKWCTNCHSGMVTNHGHPSGANAQLGGMAALYDSYVSSGNLTGNHATAYDHFVPFERGTAELSSLNPFSTEGPDAHSNVMCLTCHRAHASPYGKIGRWDFDVPILTDSPVLKSPQGNHAFYGEDIATRYNPYQRSLCNKCHVED